MLSEMNWLGGPWLQDCCTWQILSVQYCTSLPVQTRVLLIHSILTLPLSSFSAVETRVSVGMWSSWDDASVCGQVLALVQCKTAQSMETLGCSCPGTPESLWTSGPCWPSHCHNIAVSSAWACWHLFQPCKPWVLLHSSCVPVLVFCAGDPLRNAVCLTVWEQ